MDKKFPAQAQIRSINKAKDELSLSEKILVCSGFAKAIDTAAGMNISGAVNPGRAKAMFSTMVKQNEFLSKIRTEIIDGTKFPLDCYDITARGTKRPSPIVANMTDTDTNVNNVGNELDLKPMQLRYFLDYQVIQEKAYDEGFQSFIENLVFDAFSNDIADLALNGILDDYTNSLWVNMNKGFPTLFAADAKVNDVTYSSYEDRFLLYKAMMAAMPAKYRANKNLTFFDSMDGVLDYWSVLANQDTTAATMQQEKDLPKFASRNIIGCSHMPASKVFLADPSKLVVGFSKKNIRMTVKEDDEAFGVKIILTAMVDYNYVNGYEVVYAS